MTSEPSFPLRLSRLENETVSIYEILSDIQATQAEHTSVLARHDARFDQVDATLGEVLRRLPEAG